MPEAIGQLKFNSGKHLDGALDAAGTFKRSVIHYIAATNGLRVRRESNPGLRVLSYAPQLRNNRSSFNCATLLDLREISHLIDR